MNSSPSLKIKDYPTVGVLITDRKAHQLLKQRPHQEYIALVRANEKVRTTLYFFPARQVDFNRNMVKGIVFNKATEEWEEKNVPFPDVLYRKCSFQHCHTSFWRHVQSSGTKMINYKNGFNKWDILRLFQRKQNMRKHLPATINCQSVNDVIRMLNKFNVIYLKGHNGSQGKRLLQVSRRSAHSVIISSLDKSLEQIRADQINKKIREFFGNQKFILQERINLMRYKNRITDMRAQVHRNGQGEIEVVKVAVRVGARQSPISTHGDSYPFATFFKDILHFSNNDIRMMKYKIHAFLKDVYQTIESKYGPCGEMGIDFGIDKHKKIWFIESNAKPMKVSINNAYGMKGVEDVYTKILEYAKYLYR